MILASMCLSLLCKIAYYFVVVVFTVLMSPIVILYDKWQSLKEGQRCSFWTGKTKDIKNEKVLKVLKTLRIYKPENKSTQIENKSTQMEKIKIYKKDYVSDGTLVAFNRREVSSYDQIPNGYYYLDDKGNEQYKN